jgi:hypothetical protein
LIYLSPEPSLVFARELGTASHASQMTCLDECHLVVAHGADDRPALRILFSLFLGSSQDPLVSCQVFLGLMILAYISLCFYAISNRKKRASQCVFLTTCSVNPSVEAVPPRSLVSAEGLFSLSNEMTLDSIDLPVSMRRESSLNLE